MYMSYCRFDGTFAELRACLTNVEEHINEEAEYKVSKHEIEQFTQMVEYFHAFLAVHDLIDYDGELDQNRLTEIAEAMEKGSEDDF